jgi:hypothetical protein
MAPISKHDEQASMTKRKPTKDLPGNAPAKKHRSQAVQAQTPSLVTPHEAILSELAPKYDVLPASVISSTKINKRVTAFTAHLLATSDRAAVGLLYARTADVCKLITIVEQCKRVLAEEGKAWYQYNQLFNLPVDKKKPRGVVEETALEREEGEEDAAGASDSDDFEVMESRFEKAVLPSVTRRVQKSMRVFLATRPIPELKSRDGATLQSSETTKS